MNSAYGMPIAVHDANHASSLHFNNLLQSTPRAPARPARTTPLTEQEETINDIREFWTNLFSISPPSPEQEETINDIRMFWKNLFSVPPPASPEKDSAERDFRAFWNKVFCAYRHVIPERPSGEKSAFESFKEFFMKQHNFGRSPFAGMPTSWM
jgi:hypothetical protein